MQGSRIASAGIALALALALGGCAGVGGSPPEAAAAPAAAPASSDPRALAVAEIRAKAEAAGVADTGEYPPVFGASAPAAETKTPADLAAIERELDALGRAQRAANAPGEVASLRRRAADLERLRDELRGTMEDRPAGPPSP